MENITENNKLIAEFMGLETGKQLGYDRFLNDWFDNRGVLNGQRNEKLLFDTDWNWLMSVVEKIESIEYGIYQVDILQEGCKILKRCSLLIDKRVDKLKSDTTKLESVYQAVVEFIKWHNEQNKNNG